MLNIILKLRYALKTLILLMILLIKNIKKNSYTSSVALSNKTNGPNSTKTKTKEDYFVSQKGLEWHQMKSN